MSVLITGEKKIKSGEGLVKGTWQQHFTWQCAALGAKRNPEMTYRFRRMCAGCTQILRHFYKELEHVHICMSFHV